MRNGYRLVRLENQRNCQRDKTSTVLTVEYHDGTVNLFHGCSPRQQRVPPLKIPEEFEFCYYPDHVRLVFFWISPFPTVLYIPLLAREGVVKSRFHLPFARKNLHPNTGFIGSHRGNKGWSSNEIRVFRVAIKL